MLSGLASVELPSLALSSGLFELGGMFMIEPFNAVGLVPTVWGVRNRREIEKNIEHLASMAKASLWLSSFRFTSQVNCSSRGGASGI